MMTNHTRKNRVKDASKANKSAEKRGESNKFVELGV